MSTDLKQTILQVLEEAFAVNKNAIKVSGIFKRQGGYRLGRFRFVPLTNVGEIGKQAIVTDVFESENNDAGSIGQLVFVNKTTGTNGEISAVLFDGLFGTSTSDRVIKAIPQAIQTAQLSIANDEKPTRFNIGRGENKSTVYVFGPKLEREVVTKLINAIHGRENDEDEKQDLKEATSQMTVSTATGNTPAPIRLKGSGSSAISKLITTINSLRSTLFLQQVQDNGTCVVFTFGRPNKPTVELLVQRRAGGGNMGPKAFGVNATGISDGSGTIIKDPCVALIQVSDKSGVLAYSGTNSRVKTIVRGDNQISSNNIAGVPLTTETVAAISGWLKSIATSSSALQIANSWSDFVQQNTPTKQ